MGSPSMGTELSSGLHPILPPSLDPARARWWAGPVGGAFPREPRACPPTPRPLPPRLAHAPWAHPRGVSSARTSAPRFRPHPRASARPRGALGERSAHARRHLGRRREGRRRPRPERAAELSQARRLPPRSLHPAPPGTCPPARPPAMLHPRPAHPASAALLLLLAGLLLLRGGGVWAARGKRGARVGGAIWGTPPAWRRRRLCKSAPLGEPPLACMETRGAPSLQGLHARLRFPSFLTGDSNPRPWGQTRPWGGLCAKVAPTFCHPNLSGLSPPCPPGAAAHAQPGSLAGALRVQRLSPGDRLWGSPLTGSS